MRILTQDSPNIDALKDMIRAAGFTPCNGGCWEDEYNVYASSVECDRRCYNHPICEAQYSKETLWLAVTGRKPVQVDSLLQAGVTEQQEIRRIRIKHLGIEQRLDITAKNGAAGHIKCKGRNDYVLFDHANNERSCWGNLAEIAEDVDFFIENGVLRPPLSPQSVEPEELSKLIESGIGRFLDERYWEQQERERLRGRATLRTLVAFYPEVVAFLREKRKEDDSPIICEGCGATERNPKCYCDVIRRLEA